MQVIIRSERYKNWNELALARELRGGLGTFTTKLKFIVIVCHQRLRGKHGFDMLLSFLRDLCQIFGFPIFIQPIECKSCSCWRQKELIICIFTWSQVGAEPIYDYWSIIIIDRSLLLHPCYKTHMIHIFDLMTIPVLDFLTSRQTKKHFFFGFVGPGENWTLPIKEIDLFLYLKKR